MQFGISGVELAICAPLMDQMTGEEPTLRLEDEGNWRWWIPNTTRCMDYFLGYL
ncbi:hypothetical protein AAZX31_17G156400 [Glycine max]